MLKSLLGTNRDVDRMVPWLRRGLVRVPLFSPKPSTIRWCTGQPSFCLPFNFYFSLGCFHWFFASLLFCFLDKAGVFVGSSVVVPPVFPFFSSCLPCPFVFCLFSFCPFFVCVYYEFILAEDLCVHLPLLLISLSGGFFCEKVCVFFPPFYFYFNLCTGCQGVKMYFWVLWSIWIYSLYNWQGRRFHPKRPFLPFTKDQPSESRAMRDRYPLVKNSCLCGCPQGNRLGTISSSNLQGCSYSFDCCLSGRCERKTTTLWSAALCIPRPHIRVAFSLWTDWWWKRASFAIRLSRLFVTSETTSRISRVFRD